MAEIEARRTPGLSNGAIVPSLEGLVLDALSGGENAGSDRRRVLDLASGSGLVAIAAAVAGACTMPELFA